MPSEAPTLLSFVLCTDGSAQATFADRTVVLLNKGAGAFAKDMRQQHILVRVFALGVITTIFGLIIVNDGQGPAPRAAPPGKTSGDQCRSS